MKEIAGILFSFLCMFLLLRKNINFALSTFISTIVLVVIVGFPFTQIVSFGSQSLTNRNNLGTMLSVFGISLLGGVCKEKKILSSVVDELEKIIPNEKTLLMLIPAFLGLLTVTGGAILSIPFVDSIGDKLSVCGSKKACINLVFRHLAIICLPFSTPILVAASMTGMPLQRIVLLQLPVCLFSIIAGYFMLIRPIPGKKKNRNFSSVSSSTWKRLLINLSPIAFSVLMNIITKINIGVCCLIGVALALFISDRKDLFKTILYSCNWKVVVSVAAVLFLQNCISQLSYIMSLLNKYLGQNMLLTTILVCTAAFLFALMFGMSHASLSIVLPLVVLLNIPESVLWYLTFVAVTSAFLGYFYSPLHLCQVYTIEYLKISSAEVYREYKDYSLMFISLIVLMFVLMGLILL